MAPPSKVSPLTLEAALFITWLRRIYERQKSHPSFFQHRVWRLLTIRYGFTPVSRSAQLLREHSNVANVVDTTPFYITSAQETSNLFHQEYFRLCQPQSLQPPATRP